MGCIDDNYHEKVRAPLAQSKKDLKWVLQRIDRGSLTPEHIQLVVQTVIGRLTKVDEHLSRL